MKYRIQTEIIIDTEEEYQAVLKVVALSTSSIVDRFHANASNITIMEMGGNNEKGNANGENIIHAN